MRILVGSYMVRYPLGGMLSWALQYVLGFHRLGHDVVMVEKAHYPNACFDPSRRVMADDCEVGLRVVNELLGRFDLADRWCFIDVHGRHYGKSEAELAALFRSADVFVDGGTHGAWLEDARESGCRVLIDGEPGYTQMKWESWAAKGQPVPVYDRYFTNGSLLGTDSCSAPLAGRKWEPVWNPVLPELFDSGAPPPGAAYTTVMHWQSQDPIEHGGRTYYQKDVEFSRFIDLPSRVDAPLEVAVAGKYVPRRELERHGWRSRQGHDVTGSFDAYREYIRDSRGELSVCKHVFVATHNGWFSDRSAAYLAAGRPVVLQDTGFSERLPTGEGLFAPTTVAEAADAIDRIEKDYERHSQAARRIAHEHLDARVVLGRLLESL